MNILLSAFSCSPYQGSEYAVGWNFAIELAKSGHQITVLYGDLSTTEQSRFDVENYFLLNTKPSNLNFIYVKPSFISRTLERLHAMPYLWFLYYQAYRFWQKDAFIAAKKLHSITPFDLSHQLTIIGYREPSYLWKLKIPFFWGPVSGAPNVPWIFTHNFGMKEKMRWRTHYVLNHIQMFLGGRARKAAGAAEKIWVVSYEDLKMFGRWGVVAELMPEYSATNQTSKPKHRSASEPLRICWSGIFQGRKALPLLLKSIASLPKDSIRLEILGDGPEAERWKNLSQELGIESQILWHGKLSRKMALAAMNQCHALIITSLKEASSIVAFEALERGLPVICHDACGMGVLINERCGIKIPLTSPSKSIENFTLALKKLIDDPNLITQLSGGALERSRELNWDKKMARLLEAYYASMGNKLNTHTTI